MKEIEMAIPAAADVSIMVSMVEAQCAAEGLQLTLKGTLAKYPGCVHWHFKRGSERGTLEITWWAKTRRFWFSIQAGRTGAWLEPTSEQLKEVLTKRLAASSAN